MQIAQMQISELLGLRGAVILAQSGIILSLILGTIIRTLSLRAAPPDIVKKRLASLRTWWVIVILFSLALVFGRAGGVIFFTLVSLLAVKEFLTLSRLDHRDRQLTVWIYVAIVLNYLWIYLGRLDLFLVFLPLCMFLFIPIHMVLRDKSKDFFITVAGLHWGSMLTVYCLAHAPLLLTLPADTNKVGGPAGWLVYLLLLTAMNDIVQALIGRKFGRHKVAPVLSPHKTWEGLIGGVAITSVLAVVLAPALTPLGDLVFRIGSSQYAIPFLPAFVAGLIIGVGGYLGDLTISG